MVSYYNPLAMYRHQQQTTAAASGPPQFHHPTSPAATWYAPPAGYQHSHHHQVPPPLQQYPSCEQEEQQGAGTWHHHHPMLQHEWSTHDFGNAAGMLPTSAALEDPQLPSPPITVSSSELSSPGAVGDSITSQLASRPVPVRSPYEWMKKPSYQSQPNPGQMINEHKLEVDSSECSHVTVQRCLSHFRGATV